jgi:hypothetical protein
MKFLSRFFKRESGKVNDCNCVNKCENNDGVKAKDIIGRTVISAGRCDKCAFERADCVKVYIKGIGDVCLK